MCFFSGWSIRSAGSEVPPFLFASLLSSLFVFDPHHRPETKPIFYTCISLSVFLQDMLRLVLILFFDFINHHITFINFINFIHPVILLIKSKHTCVISLSVPPQDMLRLHRLLDDKFLNALCLWCKVAVYRPATRWELSVILDVLVHDDSAAVSFRSLE